MNNPALELVKAGVDWLAQGLLPSGELNDPVFQSPAQYGTAYFALANAFLAQKTSGADRQRYAEAALRSLKATLRHLHGDVDPDPAVADFTHTVASPGFRNLRDFMWPPAVRSFLILRRLDGVDLDLAPVEEEIRQIDVPHVFSELPPVNWAAVWLVGEWLRVREGLSPYSITDIDRWLSQFFIEGADFDQGFNRELRESIGDKEEWKTAIDLERGFFREPGVPNSYDLFSRVHMLELLVDGYDGAWAGKMRELLVSGIRRSLGVQLSSGSLATAFRSSAHLWNLTAQVYYFFFGSRLLAEAEPALSKQAAVAAVRAFRACQACLRPTGGLSPVENALPGGWRVGYEVYTMEAHYVTLPLSFLTGAIAEGFDGDGEVVEDSALRVLIDPDPVNRHLVHRSGISVHVNLAPFAGYDPLGIADLTLGVGRRLRFGGQTHHGRDDPDPYAHRLTDEMSLTLGMAVRDPDQSVHPVAAMRPVGAHGVEPIENGLRTYADVERGRYELTVQIADNRVDIRENLAADRRSLIVPYLRDRGDGYLTEVERMPRGLKLRSGDELLELSLDDDIERMIDLPFGYESRHGLVGLVRLDLTGEGPVTYRLIRLR